MRGHRDRISRLGPYCKACIIHSLFSLEITAKRENTREDKKRGEYVNGYGEVSNQNMSETIDCDKRDNTRNHSNIWTKTRIHA